MTHLDPLLDHLRLHWHRHLTIVFSILAILSFAAGYGAARTVSGGYHPAQLPPPIALSGGPLPASWSLNPYVVRVHNQGSSNRCTGQTASTIIEIDHKEATGQNLAFSSGYVWNQAAGYGNNGADYPAIFTILQTQGDAPLSAFYPDGSTAWWIVPNAASRAAAYPYRITSWRSIDPSDRYTIESFIHQGYPVAIAIPVFDTFYNQFGTGSAPMLTSDTGSFHFWHSMTGIAYSPFGVELLNSWGPLYGDDGRVWISWNLLASYYYAGWHAQVVVSTPLEQKPKNHPFHAKRWNSWRKAHHKSLIPYRNVKYRRGDLQSPAPLLKGPATWNRRYKSYGGVVRKRIFPRNKTRRHGFTKWAFQGGTIYVWTHGQKFDHHKWKL